MYGDGEDIYYYLTAYNENYVQPPKPDGVDQGIIDGIYRWSGPPEARGRDVTILFSGTANLAAREAQQILADDYGVGAELWSVTSYKNLREQAMEVERWNLMHPAEDPKIPLVTSELSSGTGPTVAVTDFLRMVPDQIGRWIPGEYVILGTDGFGRSDTRSALRRFFETDAGHVTFAALSSLAKSGRVGVDAVNSARDRFGIDTESSPPWTR